MADSDFLRLDRVHDRVAEGIDPIRDPEGRITGWKRNIYSFPPIGSPDGGAHVTAGDLDRFLRAVKAGELLLPESTSAFLTPQVQHGPMAGGTRKYGFGLWFCVDDTGHVLFGEKEGCVTGVSGLIRHYFESDINVVILSNSEQGAWDPIRKVHEVITARDESRVSGR
jgi:hypothetical protein